VRVMADCLSLSTVASTGKGGDTVLNWQTGARQDTDGNVIRRMHFTRWATKDIDKHSEYLICIYVPRQ
jgi:hypothetical protein